MSSSNFSQASRASESTIVPPGPIMIDFCGGGNVNERVLLSKDDLFPKDQEIREVTAAEEEEVFDGDSLKAEIGKTYL